MTETDGTDRKIKVVVVSRDMNNIAEKKSSELEVNFALMFANIRE